MGLLNAAYTLGVAMGAILAGALEPIVTWVGLVCPLSGGSNRCIARSLWIANPLRLVRRHCALPRLASFFERIRPQQQLTINTLKARRH